MPGGHQDQHHRVQTRQAFLDGLVLGSVGNTGMPELRGPAHAGDGEGINR